MLGLVRPGTAITPQTTMHAINVVLSNPGVCVDAPFYLGWHRMSHPLECIAELLQRVVAMITQVLPSLPLSQARDVTRTDATDQHAHAEPDNEWPSAAPSYPAATRSGVWICMSAA